jgi:hypothetical protein
MADVIDLNVYAPEDFAREAAQQRAANAKALRQHADRIELLRDAQLAEALPIAAWGLAELQRRLAPWVR